MNAGLVGAYVAITGLTVAGLLLVSSIRSLEKASRANREANEANTRAIAHQTSALRSLLATVERQSSKTSINVTGITDPAAVAAAVKKSLDRRSGGDQS